MNSRTMAPAGAVPARLDEAKPRHVFVERRAERRTDPVLGALIDVAIAYRDNLGCRVAEAFLRETGVPEPLARRVLDRSALQRSIVPRRWAPRTAPEPSCRVER
jgi:hypothetical protein